MVRIWIGAAAAILAAAPLEAEAGTLAFSFETSTMTVSGDLAVSNTPNAIGGYDVTGLTGTLHMNGSNAAAISLVVNPNQPYAFTGAWIYDNVVFASGSWIDNSGLLFTDGAYGYNLYESGLVTYLSSFNPAGDYNPGQVVDALTVSVIPEPATWIMMGLGFAALGAAGRRRDRLAAFA